MNKTPWMTCPECSGQNAITVIDRVDGLPCEVSTCCRKCGHHDYWAYGSYTPVHEPSFNWWVFSYLITTALLVYVLIEGLMMRGWL